MPSKTRPRAETIALPYRLFFLYIEPISALLGAYYAHFDPHAYLHLTHAASTPSAAALPAAKSTIAALSQLANLYVLFALSESLVLRSTRDLAVWRTLLFVLAVADLGHLWSMKGTGDVWEVYGAFWQWNSMGWGSVGFVYGGFLMRCLFLRGVGVRDR